MEQKQYAITHKYLSHANNQLYTTQESVDIIWAFSFEEAYELFKKHNIYSEIKEITELEEK